MTALDAAVAGAAGGTALNVVTYLDIAIRGRPVSRTPEETVRRLAEKSRVRLGSDATADNRRSGIGPLLGYGAAIGTAVIFGAAARNRHVPVPMAAPILAAGALVAADAPLTVLRVTDPRAWSLTDWLSDLVPHLAYGVATAAVWHRLTSTHRRGRMGIPIRRS